MSDWSYEPLRIEIDLMTININFQFFRTHDNKGAFSRAIFLWQRSIVTETLAKYLCSHTATKRLKKFVEESLLTYFCHIIFAVVFTRMMINQRKLPEQNIFVRVN